MLRQTMPDVAKFRCPNCDTPYKVVRVEAGPKNDRELVCPSCGGPLRNREGKFALKYFRTDGARNETRGRKPKL